MNSVHSVSFGTLIYIGLWSVHCTGYLGPLVITSVTQAQKEHNLQLDQLNGNPLLNHKESSLIQWHTIEEAQQQVITLYSFISICYTLYAGKINIPKT